MPKLIKYGLLLLLLLLIVSVPLAMQFESGAIEGLITNDKGTVAVASVEVRNVMSGASFHAESDSNGYYRIGHLKAGRYSLRVESPGHDSTWIPDLIVERNQTTHTDLHLVTSAIIAPGD